MSMQPKDFSGHKWGTTRTRIVTEPRFASAWLNKLAAAIGIRSTNQRTITGCELEMLETMESVLRLTTKLLIMMSLVKVTQR